MSPSDANNGKNGDSPRITPLAVLQLANDLRHELSAIVRRVDAIRAKTLGRPDVDRDFEHIDSAIDGGFDVARELIAFVQRSGQTGVVDVNDLLKQTEGIMQRMLGAGIRLHLQLSDSPLRVRADVLPLEWVVLSLVLHGREAMAGVGSLTIATASLDPASPEVQPRLRADRWVRVDVTDTGAAMQRDARERPIELSFSTRSDGNGTAPESRLSSVGDVVRQLGGWMRTHKIESFGNHFEVYLPAAGPVRL